MAGGVYTPDDGPRNPWGLNEWAGTGRNRRAISQFFKTALHEQSRPKTQPAADDTMRLVHTDDANAPPLPRDGNGASTSTGNGYWQSFVEAARKKSWYSFTSSTAAGTEGKNGGLDSDQAKQKDKIQFLSRRNARSSNSTMQNVLKRKIYVSSHRAEELMQLQQQARVSGREELEQARPDEMIPEARPALPSEAQSSENAAGRVPVLLLGFTDKQVQQIQSELSDAYCCRAETFIERDWVALMKSSAAKYNVEDPLQPPPMNKKSKAKANPPQIVAIRFTESEITEFQWCCIATQFMASRIVAPVVDTEVQHRANVHEALATFMQDTWPVHSNIESFCQFCMQDVPRLLSLRKVIQEDVRGRIQHLGKVNYLWHGAKRVPVSFVPFGVSAVNFLGLSRLVAKILLKVGMLKDAETKKAGLLLAGQSYAKVFLLDNLGDLYQLTAAGAVVASLSSALMMGEGLAVAVGALSVSDFALLGSASIVTGAVAAIGAALTRPEMVESLCLLIATLQTLWCAFPQTRRQGASESGEEMTPEQKETAEKLARLALMPASTAPDVPAPASSGLVQEVCKADMDNTLQLLLDEEEFLDSAGCSAPANAAPAPGNGKQR